MTTTTKTTTPTLSEILETKVSELLSNIDRKNTATALKNALEIKALFDACQLAAPYITTAIKQLEDDTKEKEIAKKKKEAPPLEKLSLRFGPAPTPSARTAAVQTPPQPAKVPPAAANPAANNGPAANAAQSKTAPTAVVTAPPQSNPPAKENFFSRKGREAMGAKNNGKGGVK